VSFLRDLYFSFLFVAWGTYPADMGMTAINEVLINPISPTLDEANGQGLVGLYPDVAWADQHILQCVCFATWIKSYDGRM
jgi:hypothetical protein